MKKSFILLTLTILLSTQSFAWWTSLYNRGTPVFTYYLGDKLAYQFEFAVNQETSPMTVSYGIGQSTDGSSWNWYSATWSRMDGLDNRVWISNANEHQFTATGNWYYSGRFVLTAGGYTEYASDDWAEYRTSLSASSYFTVSALGTPTSPTATVASSSQINLSWTKWNSKNVMIVRSTSSTFTAPTQGTTYTVGNTIGSGTVIYNGSATSFNDTGLDPGTTYYYAYYSENYSYYSTNSSANATTYTEYRSKTTGNWNATSTWEKNTNGSWVDATTTPTSSDWTITILNGHTVTVTANVTVDQVIIQSGGILVLSGGTLTINNGSDANDFVIQGTYRRSSVATTMSINSGAIVHCDNGGVYAHNVAGGSLPNITWSDGSELKIENSLQTGLNQSFWNVRVTGGNASCVTYNDNNSRTMTVRNNFLLESGTFYLKNAVSTGGTHVLRVVGNFYQTGGSFSWNSDNSDNISVLKLELEKDLIIAGGTWGGYISATDCNSAVYFLGTGEQTYKSILEHGVGGEARNRFVYKTSGGPTGLNEIYNGSDKQYTIACTCVSVPAGFSKWPESGTQLKSLTVSNPNNLELRHNRTINDSLYLVSGQIITGANSITMADNTFINRSGGSLAAAPTFGSSVDVIYSQHSSQNTTSYEIPTSASALKNLTVNSSNGAILGSNIQANGTCLVSNGTLSLSDKTLTIGNNGVITNNSTINSGTSTVVFAGVGTVGGSSETVFNNVTINGSDGNAGVDFGANKSTINGNLLINTWGYANYNAPKYGASSNLIYNTGAVYDRRVEWGASGVGTIGTTPGYPNNISITGSTTLNYAHETVGIEKALYGNLTIEAGSSLFMDYGLPNPGISNPLTVGGNVVINGNLSLGNALGGDIIVKGNWTRGVGGNFSPNERAVFFTGTSDQTINSSGGELFDYVILDNSNNLILASNATIEEKLEMTSGNINTGLNLLTLGTSTSEKGEITYTSGLIYGQVARWFNGTNSGDASGFVPLGYLNDDRFVTVEYGSAPTSGGTLTFSWVNAEMGTAGLPVTVTAAGSCLAFDAVNTADDGYWQIDAGNGLSNDGNYDITLVGENVFGINDLCKLTSLKRVGGGNWQRSGVHIEPAGTISRPVLKSSGAIGWSNWGIGGGTENPLPVSLSEFSADCYDNYVLINWATESELNNDYFIIERSYDDFNWQIAGQIPGAGNSNQYLNYKFTDSKIKPGIVYYRLKQADFDGSFTYSQVISSSCLTYKSELIIYPNPSNGIIYISGLSENESPSKIIIRDNTGKIVYNDDFSGNNMYSINLSHLQPGIYNLGIYSEMQVYVSKIILTK